jgi:hypothetical protein
LERLSFVRALQIRTSIVGIGLLLFAFLIAGSSVVFLVLAAFSIVLSAVNVASLSWKIRKSQDAGDEGADRG